MKLVKLNNNLRRNNTLLPEFWGDFDSSPSLLDSVINDFWKLPNNSVKTWETPENYTLEIEVPGFKKEDINVSVNSGKLSIQASNNRNDVKNQFYREILLEKLGYLDLDKGIAKLEDGVLTINIPKTEKAKGRQIKIE